MPPIKRFPAFTPLIKRVVGSHVELLGRSLDHVTEPMPNVFYYARVIEIPTPRWTAYDAKRFGDKMDAKVPMTTRERAYTSPIWYNPQGSDI